jgi:hypothetical protein
MSKANSIESPEGESSILYGEALSQFAKVITFVPYSYFI